MCILSIIGFMHFIYQWSYFFGMGYDVMWGILTVFFDANWFLRCYENFFGQRELNIGYPSAHFSEGHSRFFIRNRRTSLLKTYPLLNTFLIQQGVVRKLRHARKCQGICNSPNPKILFAWITCDKVGRGGGSKKFYF
jgi:hypothetical protein